MIENSTYKYVDEPDRLIFMSLPDKPYLNFIKIIDRKFIDLFSNFVSIDISRFVEKENATEIIGGFSVFKIDPDRMEEISKNQELMDISFVITSNGIFGVLKKFLYTNNEEMVNSISEINAYIDVEVKTQFAKYGIVGSSFLIDREMALFIALSGTSIYKIDTDASNKIKHSYFNIFSKGKTNANSNEIKETKNVNKPNIQQNNQKPKTIKNKIPEKEENNDKLYYDTIDERAEKYGEGHEIKNFFKEWFKELFFGSKGAKAYNDKIREDKEFEYQKRKRAVEIEQDKLKLEQQRKELKEKKENPSTKQPQSNDEDGSDDDVGL